MSRFEFIRDLNRQVACMLYPEDTHFSPHTIEITFAVDQLPTVKATGYIDDGVALKLVERMGTLKLVEEEPTPIAPTVDEFDTVLDEISGGRYHDLPLYTFAVVHRPTGENAFRAIYTIGQRNISVTWDGRKVDITTWVGDSRHLPGHYVEFAYPSEATAARNHFRSLVSVAEVESM